VLSTSVLNALYFSLLTTRIHLGIVWPVRPWTEILTAMCHTIIAWTDGPRQKFICLFPPTVPELAAARAFRNTSLAAGPSRYSDLMRAILMPSDYRPQTSIPPGSRGVAEAFHALESWAVPLVRQLVHPL
jgi:hypothetical protein